MIDKKGILISVILVAFIFSCACIDVGKVINPQEEVIEEGKRDVLVIRDLMSIPLPPILPNQPVTLSFTLENQDELKPAKSVYVDLFDPAIFTIKDDLKQDLGTILPYGQKQVMYNLMSPTTEKIANVITRPTLSFKINYDFDTSTSYDIVVVSQDEIIRLQRAGETLTIPLTKSIGSGPMQIDVELMGNKAILAGQDANIIFRLVDKGSGSLKDSELAMYDGSHGMVIEFPSDIVSKPEDIGVPPSEKYNDPGKRMFTCTMANNVYRCENEEEIKLYKGKSSPLLFVLHSVKLDGVPYKTYTINALLLNYTYELRDQITLEVRPYELT